MQLRAPAANIVSVTHSIPSNSLWLTRCRCNFRLPGIQMQPGDFMKAYWTRSKKHHLPKSIAEKLTMTVQTMVTAKMDLDPWKLYSDGLKTFLTTKVEPRVNVPGTTHRFWPTHLSLSVFYKTSGDDFILTPKPITIEPRVGTTPEQSIFFVHSPLDSEAHLQLMHELEVLFHKDDVAGASS